MMMMIFVQKYKNISTGVYDRKQLTKKLMSVQKGLLNF